MGNKSSSNKDPQLNSESRARSRSFNGIVSRFRKASKSPPRDRSNSFGEVTKPQRKGSGKNGVYKSGQNGHMIKKGPDVPISTLTNIQAGVAIPVITQTDVSHNEKSAPFSQSAPSGRLFNYHYSSPAKQSFKTALQNSKQQSSSTMPLNRQDSPLAKNSVRNVSKGLKYVEEESIIKSSNLKNLKNIQLPETDKYETETGKPALIENYVESPHLPVAKIRNVSHEFFSEHLEDLAKRRGMATLNRDLSLSNVSLGLLSNRSKSMQSLCSYDWDYEERCKVGELLFEESSKVGELCRSITSQFSSVNNENKDSFMRPRTNSTSALDMGWFDKNHAALGASSVEIRRNLASQYAIDPKKSSQKSISSGPDAGPDVIQAQRMLVARALKDENPVEMSENLPQKPQTPVVGLQKQAFSPIILPNEIRSSPSSLNQIQGRMSPVSCSQGRSPHGIGHCHSESPISNKSLNTFGLGRQTAEKIPETQVRTTSTILKNLSTSQLLAANMTKSMQKFLLDNQGVGVNSTDYEKLNNKLQKKKKTSLFDSGARERSNSFSILSSKQQQQQFVQQMIQEQQASILKQLAEPVTSVNEHLIIHVQSKSCDSTPVSTGGDSGFRSRSQSWSSLSRKSVYESQQQINSVNNPISNLWSYSELSLVDLPMDLTSQPHRYISLIEDECPVPKDLNFSHDLDAIQNLGMDSTPSMGTLGITQSHQHLSSSDWCQTCKQPFDKGKKRKLTDQCGHERCWTCMFSTKEECPLCANSVLQRQLSAGYVRHSIDLGHRPKVKTNGHFTAYMQMRTDSPDSGSHYYQNQLQMQSNAGSRVQCQQYQQPPGGATAKYKVMTSAPPPNLPPSVKSFPQQLVGHHAVGPNFQIDSYKGDPALGSPDSGSLGQGHDLEDLAVTEKQMGHMESMAVGKVGKSSLLPPPPDVAHDDLVLRLGQLLGNRSNSQSPEHMSQGLKPTTLARDDLGGDSSPMSTLTVSSGSDHGYSTVHPAYGAPHHSRDPSSDSIVSITSVSSSVSPHDTSVRPHSITTSAPGAIEDLDLFKSKSKLKQPTRATIGFMEDSKVQITPIRPPQLHLTPINFEVPHTEDTPIFVGREWVFRDIDLSLNGDSGVISDQPAGVIITGGLGSGKTKIIEQLVAHSCFGDGKTGLVQAPASRQATDRLHSGVNYSSTSALSQNLSGSNTSLNYDALRTLGSQVVAYHYCQADVNITCMVPEFVHSLAAYLARAPQLHAYKELLLQDPQLQQLLSLQQCVQDTSYSFVKGILEPLDQIRQNGKLESDTCIIVIDALNEAEFHKPDYGDTITSFIVRHIANIPSWFKLVLSVHTSMIEITNMLAFPRIYIDKVEGNDMLVRDLQEYVIHRVQSSVNMKLNMALKTLDASATGRFASYMQALSNGCFLFCKQTLDLIEQGHVVLKSSNYKILPQTLSEVFLLHFNIKFPSTRSFEKVSPILGICLASLYPLTAIEIFHALNSGCTDRYVTWDDFQQRLGLISGLLYKRKDNTFVFFHPAFRDWLIRRDDSDTNTKFLCDLRHGHALLALYLSRVLAPLSADKTIELGHHILKAHIYKNIIKQQSYSSRDMQALWVVLSSENLSAALVSTRNLYSPNVKVSCLILLSGANPNMRASCDDNAPILCLSAKEGFTDMVSLLLDFNANVDAISDSGMSALCYAASSGHADILDVLVLRHATINHVDNSGQCAAVHAAVSGHLDALVYLLQCDWTSCEGQVTKMDAIQQSFIVAAAMGHMEVCEYLLHMYRNQQEGFGLDVANKLLGETPLTAACLNGWKDMVLWLLDHGASSEMVNLKSFTPLLCAVEAGKWDIVDLLLSVGSSVEQTDKHGRTPLMIAAYKGHIEVLEMLLSRGASIHKTDKEGLTALCWGCLKGQLRIIQSLLERGSNLHHTDKCGRSPLQLAAFHGDVQVVQFLIDAGAQIEHADLNGMRALDRAIDRCNTAALILFLRKGAKLSPMTWAIAAGKPNVTMLLLNKLMEDGNVLYKKNHIKEAAQRYQYALKKFPQEEVGENYKTFKELKLNFILNLSRCKRKTNDCDGAIDLATIALELKPNCFEAYYARARAKRDVKLYLSAIDDLKEAIKLAPANHELQKLLMRVRDECQEQTTLCGNLTQADGNQNEFSCGSNETAL